MRLVTKGGEALCVEEQLTEPGEKRGFGGVEGEDARARSTFPWKSELVFWAAECQSSASQRSQPTSPVIHVRTWLSQLNSSRLRLGNDLYVH